MRDQKKIRVLVVDDSLFFREIISRELSKDQSFEVIGSAGDVYAAKQNIACSQPDVITLDVEMPGISGIEFLKELMPKNPLPVVVISSIGDNVFEALNSGAVDFITKPQPGKPESMVSFKNELTVKLKIASMAKVRTNTNISKSNMNLRSFSSEGCRYDFIAIGASTGGTEAILHVVKDLPSNFPGIVIVQHMPAIFTKLYADRLNIKCKMRAKEAQNGDQIVRGQIIVAAGEHHITVKKRGKSYFVESNRGEKVNGHCPSVDVLFDSVSRLNDSNTIGIILTGMGTDGAKGLLDMKNNGALTIGQTEESCVVYGMPKAAYELGAVTHQLDLNKIGEFLIKSIV